MACNNCARITLDSFIGSLTLVEPIFAPHRATFQTAQSRFLSTTYRPHRAERSAPQPRRDALGDVPVKDTRADSQPRYERPTWQAHKAAVKAKLGGESWNPRKKLSPDTIEGVRHLHATQPDKFTTPVLADHFKVSAEAIRRILKSKWQPSDEEHESRMERWDKRGEKIWSNMVELGVKPPKKWREMGVGRATNGERPKWKGRRDLIVVGDSARELVVEEEDIIPTVDGSGKSRPRPSVPLSNRL